MNSYKFYATCTISTVVEVDGETRDEAIENAYLSGDGLGQVMFLNHKYPDMGDWEIDEDVAREEYPEDD